MVRKSHRGTNVIFILYNIGDFNIGKYNTIFLRSIIIIYLFIYVLKIKKKKCLFKCLAINVILVKTFIIPSNNVRNYII